MSLMNQKNILAMNWIWVNVFFMINTTGEKNKKEVKSPQQAFEVLKKHLNYEVKVGGAKGQGARESIKKNIAFERMISRLAQSNHKDWAVKGGTLMNIRFPEMSRATKDVDLAFWNMGADVSYSEIKNTLMRDLAKNNGDMFTFMVAETKGGKMSAKAKGTSTASFHIKAMLGKNLVSAFPLDIGVEDMPFGIGSGSIHTNYSDFMDYARSSFPAISKEQHFAEKIHAYTKPREKFENMRFKDLFDMSVLVKSGLNVEKLHKTMDYVFSFRATHDFEGLDTPPESWADLYQEISFIHGLNETVDESFEIVDKYVKEIFPDACVGHEMVM